MPASKAKVIEKLSAVNGLGTSYATKAYEDLGVRNLDDLIKAARDNELQSIKGIGPAKEKSILESATELVGADEPAPTPEDKGKKEAPKKEAKTEEKPKPKKEKPKASTASSSSSSSSSSSNGKRQQRTTYRPPTQSKKRPSIPGLLFKLGKKIIGRILG